MNKDLDGIQVITLEQAVAAPYASGKLAQAGARVIKIEREEGDFARRYDSDVNGLSAYFVWLNHGKESVCLNIKDKSNKTSSYSSRYLQVCNATLGIHALVALFTNIVTLMTGSTSESLLIIFLIISLYAWFVNGHIFKNAFDTTMTIGLGFSLLHSMVCVIFMMVFIQVLTG